MFRWFAIAYHNLLYILGNAMEIFHLRESQKRGRLDINFSYKSANNKSLMDLKLHKEQ